MPHGEKKRTSTTSQPSFQARVRIETAVHAPSTAPPPQIPAVLVGLGRPKQKLDKFRESVDYLNSLEADEDAPGNVTNDLSFVAVHVSDELCVAAYKARAHPHLGGLLVARCIARTQLANLDPTRLVFTVVACVDCKSACVQEHDSKPHGAVTGKYFCQLEAQVGAYGGAKGCASVWTDTSSRFLSAMPLLARAPDAAWTPAEGTGYPLLLGPGLHPAPFLIVEHEWRNRNPAAQVHLGRTYATEQECKAIILSRFYNRRVGPGAFAGYVLVLLRNVTGMYVHQFLSFGTAPLDPRVITRIRLALIDPYTVMGHAVPPIELAPQGTVGVDVGLPPAAIDDRMSVSPRELLSVETRPDHVNVNNYQFATWTWSAPSPLPMSITIPAGLIPVVHGPVDFHGANPVPAPRNFQAPPPITIDLLTIVMAHGRATPYNN